MIDPVQIPILLKAIDFVFDEGRKILQERRERRKMDDAAPKSEVPAPNEEIVPLKIEQIQDVKQDLLGSKIDEILWQNHEWEVKSLVKQLESHTQSYYILKEQAAKWGSVLVPPVIVLQLTEREDLMVETIKRLEAILSKVYKKDISFDK